MKIPAVRGIIDRRILVNFQVDPEVLARFLPTPFRPKMVNGSGIAGVCLIRLRNIRPGIVPSLCGISSENAAHRIAVEWTSHGQCHEGVYIPRRDTSSCLNTLFGGRIFPGVHHPARFDVHEEDDFYSVGLRSKDGDVHLEVAGRLADELPRKSVFSSLEEASDFFERGSVGYSATPHAGSFDGLELRSLGWHIEPLAVERVSSSFFSDRTIFPEGSVRFDCALLMRDIDHEWHAREPLCECEPDVA